MNVGFCPICGRNSAPPFALGSICLSCAGVRVLESQTLDGAAAARASASSAPRPRAEWDLPERIGPYELIEELGRGGMGRIYAAQQTGLGRIVAVKAIPESHGHEADVELRFLREAQTVARLKHPHIVTIYDSGRSDGFVYFSMDYVEGGDLARRLRERPFTPLEAAGLLLKVAEALAYAHREGVLHRDLKPSNILMDGEEPRLADFGLAAELEGGGDLTEVTAVLGTPHYLAPEAMSGGSAALAVASDVYALGVVLFEMLTGRTPFAGATPAELPALLTQTDPPAPRLLAPAVPPDLEMVCLQCLEREPERRYAGADALADDLRRFLTGEPVMAHRPGEFQLLRKFARRHRTAFYAGGAIAAVMIAATIVSAGLAVRAIRAERRAATAAATSEEVTKFLQDDLLAQAAPERQPDRDLKLRVVLDRAAKAIEGRFADRPLVEAAIRQTLGGTYESLGEHAVAAHHLERAVLLRRQQLGDDHPLTLQAKARLAHILVGAGRLKEAEELGRSTLRAQQRVLGPRDRETLQTMHDLAATLVAEGKYAEAEVLQKQVFALQTRFLGPLDPDTLETMNELALIIHYLGRRDEAEALYRRTLDLQKKVLGPEHPKTVTTMQNLASLYWDQHRYAEDEALSRQIVDICRRLLGPEHPDTLSAMNELAAAYFGEGKFAEAKVLQLQFFETSKRVLGPEHPQTLGAMQNLAFLYMTEKNFAAAEPLMAQTVALRKRILGPEHPDTLRSMSNLAATYREEGKLTEAAALYVQTLEIRRRVLGPEHPETLKTMGTLALTYRSAGKLAQSEELERQTYEIRKRVLGAANPETVEVLRNLGDTELLQKKYAGAEAALREVLALDGPAPSAGWEKFAAQSSLGAALAGQGRWAEAEPQLVGGYEGLKGGEPRIAAKDRDVVGSAGARIVALYAAWGRPADAAAWQLKLSAGAK